MADPRPHGERRLGGEFSLTGASAVTFVRGKFAEQRVEVEGERRHLDAVTAETPLIAGPVPVDLDAVAVRITKVERFADEVVEAPSSGQRESASRNSARPRSSLDGTSTAK